MPKPSSRNKSSSTNKYYTVVFKDSNSYSQLEKDADRYRWIKKQTDLNLRTNKTQGTPWTNTETGKKYYPSHCLDVNGTGFNGIEHLDDLIDQAMELYP